MAGRSTAKNALTDRIHGEYHKQQLSTAMSNSNPNRAEYRAGNSFSDSSVQSYDRRRSNHQQTLDKELKIMKREHDKTIKKTHQTFCDINAESKTGQKGNGKMKKSSSTPEMSSKSFSRSHTAGGYTPATSSLYTHTEDNNSDTRRERSQFTDHKRSEALKRLSRLSRKTSHSPDELSQGHYQGRAQGHYQGRAKKEDAKPQNVFRRLSLDSQVSAMPSDLFLKHCQHGQKRRRPPHRNDLALSKASQKYSSK